MKMSESPKKSEIQDNFVELDHKVKHMILMNNKRQILRVIFQIK
jgi:hypothetical protein